jgi:hypothetical protein
MAKSLKISLAATKQAVAILEMQGYVKPTGSKGEWTTTPQGETVSGSKFPRYGRESIQPSGRHVVLLKVSKV